ncbi:Uncharacterised protein [Mycobacteroides abscessus]|nr:Uncharacterised protein [Mycobacteroides abscessus]SKV18348.1 Uncharacterised protein [Mycobacteroides abscessus subsp. abscessus]
MVAPNTPKKTRIDIPAESSIDTKPTGLTS